MLNSLVGCNYNIYDMTNCQVAVLWNCIYIYSVNSKFTNDTGNRKNHDFIGKFMMDLYLYPISKYKMIFHKSDKSERNFKNNNSNTVHNTKLHWRNHDRIADFRVTAGIPFFSE